MLINKLILAVFGDRKGISALEYAVLAVAVVAGLFTAAGVYGSALDKVFNTTLTSIL
jgi:Flp pilus assembly pilin Flp